MPRHRSRRVPQARRGAITVLIAAALALIGLPLGATAASAAPPVYQINGHWMNPPDTVKSGNPLVAEWRVNVNDSANPPGNDPVDNVVATFTTGKAFFQDIPDMCKTTGVDSASNISADGLTLTCNFGTVKMGTALVVQTPVVANGVTGDEVTLTGTSPSGEDVDLPPVPIRNTFGLDVLYGQNASYGVWDDVNNPHYVDTDVEWSLRLQKGSDPGPQTITYHLTVTDSNGSPVNVGVHPDFGRDPTLFDDGKPGCTRFDADNAVGHPWSRKDLTPANPAYNRVTNFVDTCTLTRTGAGTFDLTLSGIDYNPTHLPTLDSSTRTLPPAWSYIASGSLWFRVATDQAGSITVRTSAPTYRSTTGLTSDDLTTDNVTTKTYTLPGSFSSAWQRAYTHSGGSSWDDSYSVSPGTTIMAIINVSGGASPPGSTQIWGNCVTWSSASLTYQGDLSDPNDPEPSFRAQVVGYDAQGGGDQPGPLNNPPAVEYFTGNVGNPDQFDCGSGTWSTTPPANLASVHAIRIRYNHSLFDSEGRVGFQLHAYLRVNDNVATGTDIWEFGSEMRGEGVWLGPDAGQEITPTPNADYPYTTGRRDIVRIVTADPFIAKSSPSTTVTAGVPADFTLTYSANGSGIIPPSVDDFVIRDVLPPNMTYTPNSASAGEPAITTNAQGQQVLTWTLAGVTTNETHTLTYQAAADPSVPPGTPLTNTATATFDGTTTDPATKTVTTTSNGYTQIAKTADTPFIPNLDGDGSGTGSWTVTVTSNDPLPQPFTDTIDILPYNGDGRGTSFSGSYTLNEITAPAGATVYYTTADPSTLSDDPNDASNGGAAGTVGGSAGWSTTYTPSATAIRVIGGTLAAGGTLQFQVPITTSGAAPEDVYVNRAQAIAGHTDLVMRTSSKMTVAHHYAAMLKKEVQDVNGTWHDANAEADYPAFHHGDTIHYRVTVTNVGDGTLTDIDVTDDKQPQLGKFHIDTLASGESQSHEYSIKLGTSTNGDVKNTACATAATPPDMTEAPTINCDPAGFKVTNYITTKEADPAAGTPVQPGQVIHYTIKVTQQGTAPADAMFSDDLSKLLDDADYNDDAKASLGQVVHQGKTLGWTGTIPVGSVATVTYSITVHDVAGLTGAGDADLYNPVTSPGCVPQDGEYPGCTTDHKVGWFSYDKVADPKSGHTVASGDTITYTIAVMQHGKAPVTGTSVKDDLSDVLDDATFGHDAKASSGAVSYKSPILTWTGDLAVGQTVKITYTVRVTGDGSDDLINPVTSDDKRGYCEQAVGCRTEHPIEESAAAGAGTDADGSGTASTGTDAALVTSLGAVLLGAGGLLLLMGLRRRRAE